MKVLNLVVIGLLFVSSVAYSDMIGDLKIKKNNTQKQGITYTVTENDKQLEKIIITEKGNNKLVKNFDMYDYSYLFENGKVYVIPDQWQQMGANVPLMINLFHDTTELNKNFDKYKIPDYSGFKVVRRETVDGNACQLLQKVISTKKMVDEYNNPFTIQQIMRIYVTEKYGYPAKIEFYSRSKYDTEKDYTDNDIDSTIYFTEFSTDLSGKLLALPKNAYVVDTSNPNSFDTKKLLQFQKQLSDDEDDE